MLIKEAYRLEAYITESGYYSIVQEDDDGANIVLLSADQARKLVDHMQKNQDRLDEMWDVESDKGVK